MRFQGKRSRAVAAVAGAAVAGTLALGSSPASAKASDGWVRGYDKYGDDWDDEGTLGAGPGYHNPSNATCLWQRVLWAEGVKGSTGVPFGTSFINGAFTSDTRVATEALQKRWGLTADALVGNKTFGAAGNRLFKTGGSTDRGKRLELKYVGKSHTFHLIRNTEGKYVFRDGNNDWRQAGYNYRTCG